MASPAVLSRIRKLIALAGSPEIEEARSAAYLACKLMSQEQVEVGEVLGALPAHAGSPPARTWQPAPAPIEREAPDPWSTRQLEDAGLVERHRALQAQLHMREAQLVVASQRLAQERRARNAQDAVEARRQEELARKERFRVNALRLHAWRGGR
jgi:GAF domain-containing protein